MKFFYQNKPEISSFVKIGCIGSGTARTLSEFGIDSHFIGNHSDPKEVAPNFAQQIDKKEIVLFPQSNISKRTIQKALSPAQVIDTVVYQTSEQDTPLNQLFEIYIFTSPSNVRAYLKSNSIPPTSKVWAFGPTTQAELKRFDILADQLPGTSEKDIVSIL